MISAPVATDWAAPRLISITGGSIGWQIGASATDLILVFQTRKSVENGKTLVEPLRDSEVFPNMVVQMIGVGEQTGALDAMLNKIAEFYEDEVDIAVAGLVKLLEPVMIFILGVVIGGIVIAMYLPIFDLISKLTG